MSHLPDVSWSRRKSRCQMHWAISDYRALQESAPSAERKPGAWRKHFHAHKESQRWNHSHVPDQNWICPFPQSTVSDGPTDMCKSFKSFENLLLVMLMGLFFLIFNSCQECPRPRKQQHLCYEHGLNFLYCQVEKYTILCHRMWSDRRVNGNIF